MFLLQLFTYGLAMISPAIFASGFYLGLISLFSLQSSAPIIIATCCYSLYTFAFAWVHRYQPFVKPLWFFMIVVNIIVILLIITGYIRQASAWAFSPDRYYIPYFLHFFFLKN